MDKTDYIWLAVALGVIVAFGVASRVRSAAAEIVKAPRTYPEPAALDSLARYLRPIATSEARPVVEPVELVERDDFYAQPDWSEPLPDELGAPQAPTRPRWVVSAILLTDTRRMAVVNDSVVVVGSTLPGGARILEIQPDRVVLQESGGARKVVSLNR